MVHKGINAMDIYEVRKKRLNAQYEAKRKRERDILFTKCLREVKGYDAYKYLVHRAGKILGCEYGAPTIVQHFMDHRDEYDCSFIEWLYSDDGPICRYSIKGLFPEFEILTNDEYDIIQMANKQYDLDIQMDGCGDFVYAFRFNFKEINAKRVNVKEELTKSIIKELGGE